MKRWWCFLAAMALTASYGIVADENPSAPPVLQGAARWAEDLAVYRQQMPKTHGNLFHTMTRLNNSTIPSMPWSKRLPHLTSNQVKTEILRLVALVNDGHTRVKQETLGNHMLPVRLHFFPDGLYVEAGDKHYAGLVGGQVIGIGTISADNAYTRVRSLIPVDKDNEYRRETPGSRSVGQPRNSLGDRRQQK